MQGRSTLLVPRVEQGIETAGRTLSGPQELRVLPTAKRDSADVPRRGEDDLHPRPGFETIGTCEAFTV